MANIITDETMRELKKHGKSDYPFEYYYDDIHAYDHQWIAWHWHAEIELLYVQSGSILCQVGNKKIALQEGDGMFINSKAIHSMTSKQGGIMPNILFAPSFIAPKSSAVFSKYVFPLISADIPCMKLCSSEKWQADLLNILQEIFSLCPDKGPASELKIHSLTEMAWYELFVGLQEKIKKKRNCGADLLTQSRIRRMIQFIEENYWDKIALQDIAQSANISKSEAMRCFHLCLGSSPVSFLISYRLHKAAEHMENTQDTITKTALSHGFESAAYFCRAFRKQYGMSPAQYRKQK